MKKTVLGMVVEVGMIVMAATLFAQTNLTVVRHSDNTIWAMTCTGTSNCSAWTQITGGFSTQPTLAWDPALQKYLCTGIGYNGSTVWRSTFNADGTWNHDWVTIGSGATGSPSPVASSGGRLKGYFPNTAIVAPAGGDYTDPVTAMTQLSSWCSAPGFSSPCLLKLMPGLYNLGSNHLVMQPYVDLEGAGESVTTISGNNATLNGVLRGASNAEIRFLSVINTGGGALSIAISNIDNSPKINHVTATAAFGVESHGIHNSNASPTMTNVTVNAGAQTNSYGVYNAAGSAPILSRMNIFATAGSLYNVGVWDEDNAQAFVGDTVANASGGTYAIGFYSVNTAGPAQLNRSAFQASGGSGFSQAIRNDSPSSLQVGHSTIVGPVGGTLTCVFCFDTNYNPLNPSCQ